MWRYALSLRNRLTLLIFFTAVTISILMAGLLSSLYYYAGIEKLFSQQVKTSMEEAGNVARLYLNEHINSIRIDSLVVQGNIDRSPFLFADPASLKLILDSISDSRLLAEVVIFRETGDNVAHSSRSLSFLFDHLPPNALKMADKGEIYVHRKGDDKVQAISRLHSINGERLYLLVGRYLDSNIIHRIQTSESSATLYALAEKQLRSLKKPIIFGFVIGYICFFLIVLLIAKRISQMITEPLTGLAVAASRIKDGEYGFTVSPLPRDKAIHALASAFNQMSMAIAQRQRELELARDMLNQRNQFIELVLDEISAGVVVLDTEQKLVLMNKAASKILNCQHQSNVHYWEFFPELQPILAPQSSPDGNPSRRAITENMIIIRQSQSSSIKVHLRQLDHQTHNSIITFDDITQLAEAQSLKAWAEVAQKVTHEIKNPLTPIQLSVERLERKFLPQPPEEKKQFLRYTSIILERVGDIQALLREFLTFSRIAPPRIERCDIIQIVNDVILLEQNAYMSIEYAFDNSSLCCYVLCDRMQITQVLTNLCKNAAESIMARANQAKEVGFIGQIHISAQLLPGSDEVTMSIKDNGLGVLNQPSAGETTKVDGSGIGLVIVKRILQGHDTASFELKGKADGSPGAVASFRLKLASAQAHEA